MICPSRIIGSEVDSTLAEAEVDADVASCVATIAAEELLEAAEESLVAAESAAVPVGVAELDVSLLSGGGLELHADTLTVVTNEIASEALRDCRFIDSSKKTVRNRQAYTAVL